MTSTRGRLARGSVTTPTRGISFAPFLLLPRVTATQLCRDRHRLRAHVLRRSPHSDVDLRYASITESLIRSRSGGLVAAMTFSTLAAGLLQICLPLELRQLRASPNQIGLTLAMFGFGMFAFEWLWGVLADKAGYRNPLVVSQLLFAACIVLLARADSVLIIAVAYFLASGMMVAVGPIARSYLGTALHSRLRATGLALLSAQWVIAEALGPGTGGQLSDRFPIRNVILGGAVLPVISALLLVWVFRGYSHAAHH